MKAFLSMASAAVVGIIGCAPQAPGQHGERACAAAAEFPAGTQLSEVGVTGDWSVAATPTIMTCGEPTPDGGWGCVFSGPASVRVTSSDGATERLYTIADGEMGAVGISSGSVSCSLRRAH